MVTRHSLYRLLLGALVASAAGCWDPEEHSVQTGPPSQTPTEQVAYETLAPYGDWVETDVYGSVWCPGVGVVGAGFSPYGYGNWRFTSAGWYWDSAYSWGWLPYHYGNWVSLDVCPWAWVPGFVWGPAWVNWYYGYPYPIGPGAGFRARHLAYPPVHVARPVVRVTTLAPRMDVSSGRLYAGTAAIPRNAHVVTPPHAWGAAPAVAGGARPGAAVGAAARPVPYAPVGRPVPYSGGTWRGPASPAPGAAPLHVGAPVHAAPAAAPAFHAAPAPAAAPAVHAAPAAAPAHSGGGGHHR